MPRDTRALTDEVEYFDEPADDMKRAARLTICSFAENVDEAHEFMKMCGLHPSQWQDPALFEVGTARTPSRLV